MNTLERTYGSVFHTFLYVINPFKKQLIRTQCRVHKFINIQALDILKNDGFLDAYFLFYDYIHNLNEGVVWADQDFRSAGHFYHPVLKKGLYGNRNALDLAVDYYNHALSNWTAGDIEKSMFYLGAAVHLIQDMTIPQHANIRLLDNHRQYETFVIRTHQLKWQFRADHGTIYYNSIEEFIRCNARTAILIHNRLKMIEIDEKRFHVITKFTLPLAQKTTAGCFLKFYKDAQKYKTKSFG